MEHALGGSHVDALVSIAQRCLGGIGIASLRSLERCAGTSLQFRTHRTIAETSGFVLSISLLLGLDVGHTKKDLWGFEERRNNSSVLRWVQCRRLDP